MTQTFMWRGERIAYISGETVASSLLRAGHLNLGPASETTQARYFCGIGACQGCLVSCEGAAPFEACLTLARDGMVLFPVIAASTGGRHD
ncbi:(2Fe-2S)-binding protein [Mesorhizobium sp. M0751]|uniref:2Fe-2S iron-sulfur cluster-binding protein n=1 Tax=unclassified Mesorhizobium TaxID=325217 RepID=UPI00333E13C6